MVQKINIKMLKWNKINIRIKEQLFTLTLSFWLQHTKKLDKIYLKLFMKKIK
jgi:hypothetical protein